MKDVIVESIVNAFQDLLKNTTLRIDERVKHANKLRTYLNSACLKNDSDDDSKIDYDPALYLVIKDILRQIKLKVVAEKEFENQLQIKAMQELINIVRFATTLSKIIPTGPDTSIIGLETFAATNFRALADEEAILLEPIVLFLRKLTDDLFSCIERYEKTLEKDTAKEELQIDYDALKEDIATYQAAFSNPDHTTLKLFGIMLSNSKLLRKLKNFDIDKYIEQWNRAIEPLSKPEIITAKKEQETLVKLCKIMNALRVTSLTQLLEKQQELYTYLLNDLKDNASKTPILFSFLSQEKNYGIFIDALFGLAGNYLYESSTLAPKIINAHISSGKKHPQFMHIQLLICAAIDYKLTNFGQNIFADLLMNIVQMNCKDRNNFIQSHSNSPENVMQDLCAIAKSINIFVDKYMLTIIQPRLDRLSYKEALGKYAHYGAQRRSTYSIEELKCSVNSFLLEQASGFQLVKTMFFFKEYALAFAARSYCKERLQQLEKEQQKEEVFNQTENSSCSLFM